MTAKDKIKLLEAGVFVHRELLPVLCVGGTIAEIGVQHGHFFDCLMKAAPAKAYAIDAWELATTPGQDDALLGQHRMREAREAVQASYADNPAVHVVHGFSIPAAIGIPDESLDLCYIDADHTYEAVRADLAAWWPKVKRGGVLAGHDWTAREVIAPSGARFGVTEAVAEFAEANGLKVYLTSESLYQTWIVVKP